MIKYVIHGEKVGAGKSAGLAWKNAAKNIAPANEGECESSKLTLDEILEYAEYLAEGDECLSVQSEILRIVKEYVAEHRTAPSVPAAIAEIIRSSQHCVVDVTGAVHFCVKAKISDLNNVAAICGKEKK